MKQQVIIDFSKLFFSNNCGAHVEKVQSCMGNKSLPLLVWGQLKKRCVIATINMCVCVYIYFYFYIYIWKEIPIPSQCLCTIQEQLKNKIIDFMSQTNEDVNGIIYLPRIHKLTSVCLVLSHFHELF